MRDLQSLLDLQRELQVGGFQVDPITLQGDELQRFVNDNLLAAIEELIEFKREVWWLKFWKRITGRPSYERAKALVEFVDLLHHLLNVALALGFRGDELEDGYLVKRQENFRRCAAALDKNAN